MKNIKNHLQNGFSNILNFNTRASRAEFWTIWFFSYLGVFIFAIFVGFTGVAYAAIEFIQLFAIIFIFSAGIRRMHDTGRSGWWMIVPIANLVFLLSNSEPNSNLWGYPSRVSFIATDDEKIEPTYKEEVDIPIDEEDADIEELNNRIKNLQDKKTDALREQKEKLEKEIEKLEENN